MARSSVDGQRESGVSLSVIIATAVASPTVTPGRSAVLAPVTVNASSSSLNVSWVVVTENAVTIPPSEIVTLPPVTAVESAPDVAGSSPACHRRARACSAYVGAHRLRQPDRERHVRALGRRDRRRNRRPSSSTIVQGSGMVTHAGSDVPVNVNWKVSLPSVTVSWVVETESVAFGPSVDTPNRPLGTAMTRRRCARGKLRHGRPDRDSGGPGHKLLVVGNHDLNKRPGGWTPTSTRSQPGILAVDLPMHASQRLASGPTVERSCCRRHRLGRGRSLESGTAWPAGSTNGSRKRYTPRRTRWKYGHRCWWLSGAFTQHRLLT